MSAHTIDTASDRLLGSPARPALFRGLWTRLQSLTVPVELDEHLANDIGLRSYDAPVLAASWTQAFREAAARPGPLHWVTTALSRLRTALAPNPIEAIDRHLARDIGLDFETMAIRRALSTGCDRV